MRKKIEAFIKEKPIRREFALFMFYGAFALIAELVVRLICDVSFRRLDTMLDIPPFPEQALGSFLAFLISNILAKTISYIFNRKKTFKANNSALISSLIYSLVCIALLIAETIIGTPLQNFLYIVVFHGRYNDPDFSTISATSPALYQLCGTLSQLIYCAADSAILFVLNKFVIMRRKECNE